MRELEMPKALPRNSGGKLSGRSMADGRKEEMEEEEEGRRVENELKEAVLKTGPIESTAWCDVFPAEE